MASLAHKSFIHKFYVESSKLHSLNIMFIKLHTNGWKHISDIFKEREKDNEISPAYAHFDLT